MVDEAIFFRERFFCYHHKKIDIYTFLFANINDSFKNKKKVKIE